MVNVYCICEIINEKMRNRYGMSTMQVSKGGDCSRRLKREKHRLEICLLIKHSMLTKQHVKKAAQTRRNNFRNFKRNNILFQPV